MAKLWENLSESERKAIVKQVSFQNYLDEVADLDYEAYYLKMGYFELQQKLLEGIGK
jgi:hypothetical protein